MLVVNLVHIFGNNIVALPLPEISRRWVERIEVENTCNSYLDSVANGQAYSYSQTVAQGDEVATYASRCPHLTAA